MCGIFGLVLGEGITLEPRRIPAAVNRLFRLSESRGKEAAGLAVREEGGIRVYKEPLPASRMIRRRPYQAWWNDVLGDWAKEEGGPQGPLAVMGHSRLVTNGLQGLGGNNQPVVTAGVVGVHNGIVVNDQDLWNRFPALKRRFEVDTEVILALLHHFLQQDNDLCRATAQVFSHLEGSASIAVFLDDWEQMLLATNTGSLYLYQGRSEPATLFASERYILKRFLQTSRWLPGGKDGEIRQLGPGWGCLVDLDRGRSREFPLEPSHPAPRPTSRPAPRRLPLHDLASYHEERRQNLRRCTRCVLPETFPLIEFDEQGVCNYCRDYEPINLQGEDALRELAQRHRREDGRPDCIVAISGGRDSSYGLYYVKEKLGLHPVAYSYDWGMLTDLGRRNQARVCGRLGVEHILISADIKAKRRNIRRNVQAWLKRPHLGMVTLFMVGDKQYFYYANKLRRQIGVRLVFLMGNQFEKTDFKTAFTGVQECKGRLYNLPLGRKLRMGRFFLGQYLRNPAYLNLSLFDTVWAAYSSYGMRHDFEWLFNYIPWDEKEIHDTLKREFDWEEAGDTETTWRIGDGTAAFYNYIYYTVAGFSEHDTFRSHQVRAGLLTRDEALALVERDNRPRFESIRWYAQTIGLDAEELLQVVDRIPKLYA